MTLDELAKILISFTHEHYAKKDAQPFFQLLRQLSLRGLGIGTGAEVAASGEAPTMAFVRDNLRRLYPGEPWIIFDVGANLGQFVTNAVRIFEKDNCHFYSFEPSPETFAKLQEAVQGNPRVSEFCFGFGEADATVPFFSDKAGSGLASVYKRRLNHFRIPFEKIGEVSIRKIDGFCREQALPRIHFLKMDVEGHELKCLQGARGMLAAGQIEFIQFEFGGTNIDSRTFFQDFWYALPNYHLKRILRDGLLDIVAYQEIEEAFITQNFLACLKR